jgi:hypothetical protein
MEVVYTHCAGLEVHKKTVVVCVITPEAKGGQHTTRTFGTLTADLLQLSDGWQSQQVTQVAMESTGEFWKPIFNILEGNAGGVHPMKCCWSTHNPSKRCPGARRM